MAKSSFKEGAVVKMKSGSPRMTVGESHAVHPSTTLNVSWHEAGAIHTGEVLASAVEPVRRRKTRA